VAGDWNPAEAGCQLAKPTSLPLRCHVGKEFKRLHKAAIILAPHLISRTFGKHNSIPPLRRDNRYPKLEQLDLEKDG